MSAFRDNLNFSCQSYYFFKDQTICAKLQSLRLSKNESSCDILILKNLLNQLSLQAFCHQMSHNYLLKWGQVFCYVNNVLVLFINLILFMTFSTSLKLIIIYWSLWERNQLTRDFYTGLANKVDPLKICRKSLD